MKKLYFASDYQEGMCEAILERLSETNRVPVSGYGTDEYCEEAKERSAVPADFRRRRYISSAAVPRQTKPSLRLPCASIRA